MSSFSSSEETIRGAVAPDSWSEIYCGGAWEGVTVTLKEWI